jgi:hypothetical protein
MTLTFQLIFSDGGETGEEDWWKFFPVALTPFSWGVDASQVTLFLNSQLLGIVNDEDRAAAERLPRGAGWFPDGYKEYFWAVYENAVGMDNYLTTDGTGLPQLQLPENPVYDFRFVTGHGFNDFQAGGQLRFTKKPLLFGNFGPLPKVLTILDVCASPQATAVFSGNYPIGDARSFNWKKAFNDHPNPLVPVVCDRVNSTWAFRVGYDEQPDDDSDTSHFPKMTAPFGDSVAACLLLAMKSFVEDEFSEPTLNHRFSMAYKALKKGFLAAGTNTPKPYSDLDTLQEMLISGALTLNMNAFNCKMFQKSSKWYLTNERATELAETDEKLANELMDFVVECVKAWHTNNPDSMGEKIGSRDVWVKLFKTFGPFGQQLKSVELNRGEGNAIVTAEDGVVLELWAIACPNLIEVLSRVHQWISTGSPDSPDFSDDSDDQ